MVRKLLLIGAATLIIAGLIYLMSKHYDQDINVPTLRISVPLSNGPESADPAHIQFNNTWGFLENLTSPLVQWDANGQLVAGAAESFTWHGNELHLKMRGYYRTVDGLPITAEDAAFSLKRVIVLGKNTHGFIADFLCGDAKMTKVTDPCPGISVSGDTLVLRPLRGKNFLVKMLAAMDFAVLLKNEVDPETLEIRSFRNTTGPYYLNGDPKAGTQRYVANVHHWNYSASMPQEVELFRYEPKSITANDPTFGKVFGMFLDGTTNVLNNFSSDRVELYPAAKKQLGNSVSLTPTLDIGRYIAVFTPKGVREIPAARRVAIGKTLRSVVVTATAKTDGVNTQEEQFFSVFGEGSLQPDQLSLLHKAFDAQVAETSGAGLKIALKGASERIVASAKQALPQADVDVSIVDYLEGMLTKEQEPHVYIIQTDTGWTEDLGLLAYSISMKQFFPTDAAAGQSWLSHYVDVDDKAERLKLLRELHLKALVEPWIVPLVGQPYFTLVRSPWVYKGPSLFNSGALWRFHRP